MNKTRKVSMLLVAAMYGVTGCAATGEANRSDSG